MEGFFSTEGPLISFLDKLGRIIILTLLWIVCCLPVFTIGASSTAFYYSMVKTVRYERSSGCKEFLKCFKRVFKQSIIPSLGFLVITAILIVDILYWSNKNTTTAYISLNLCTVFLILLIPYCAFYFAIASRFKLKFKKSFEFTALMMLRALPVSFAILVSVLLMAFIIYVFYIAIIFVPGLVCFGFTYLFENVFKKYIPKPKDGEELWYDE